MLQKRHGEYWLDTSLAWQISSHHTKTVKVHELSLLKVNPAWERLPTFSSISIIKQRQNCNSVLTDERFSNQLTQVFPFMSGIIASQSEETAVSIVQSIASLINSEGRKSYKFLTLAFNFINECKTCAENLNAKLASTFGKSLNLVLMVLSNFTASWDDRRIKATFYVFRRSHCQLFHDWIKFESKLYRDKGTSSLTKALMVNKFLGFFRAVVQFHRWWGCNIPFKGSQCKHFPRKIRFIS